MNSKLIAALLALAPAAASAQSMNAEQFHKRAAAVQKKGMLALFSMGEIKALTREAPGGGPASGRKPQGRRECRKGHALLPAQGARSDG